MIRTFLPAFSALTLLAACGDAAPESEAESGVRTFDLEGQPGDPVPDPPPRPDGMVDAPNDGYPVLNPPQLEPSVARTETGARSLLLMWSRAIELEEFDQAWQLMSDADRAKWSRSAFTVLFADLDAITVAVPGGTLEGAAGSSYYTAPATITGTAADGRPVRYEGEVVLRRVNDVPGASAEKLDWHIESVTLDWTH